MRSVLAAIVVAAVVAASCSSDSDSTAAPTSTPATPITDAPDTDVPAGDRPSSSVADAAPNTAPSTTTTSATTTVPTTTDAPPPTVTSSTSSSPPNDSSATTVSAESTCREIYDDATAVLIAGLDVLDNAFGGLTMQEVTDLPESELDAVSESLTSVDGFDVFDAARTEAQCGQTAFTASPALCRALADHADTTALPDELIEDYLAPLNC